MPQSASSEHKEFIFRPSCCSSVCLSCWSTFLKMTDSRKRASQTFLSQSSCTAWDRKFKVGDNLVGRILGANSCSPGLLGLQQMHLQRTTKSGGSPVLPAPLNLTSEPSLDSTRHPSLDLRPPTCRNVVHTDVHTDVLPSSIRPTRPPIPRSSHRPRLSRTWCRSFRRLPI